MKIAVLTTNLKLFDSIHVSAQVQGITCVRFTDEIQLARATVRDGYNAVFLDASTGLDAVRPVLKRRAESGEHPTPTLVIALSACGTELEGAFELGADDVVTAPLDYRELLARARCAARRALLTEAGRDAETLELGAYRLDRRTSEAVVDGVPVGLTDREFALAWLLFSRAGEFVTRREIAMSVWTSSEDIVGRSLEQHVYKLRKKLSLKGDHGLGLRTRYALGYKIELHGNPVAPAAPDARSDDYLQGSARPRVDGFVERRRNDRRRGGRDAREMQQVIAPTADVVAAW